MQTGCTKITNLDKLVEDVYGVLEGKSLVDPEMFDKYRLLVGDAVIGRLVTEDRKPNLRMSNLGKPLRQLWYELNGYQGEKLTGQTLLKFSYGHLVESLCIILAEASGHKVERLQEEIEVDGVKGHIDCVIDGVLVDVKSCSSYSFNKFKYGKVFDDDPFGYVAQLSGYAHALGLPAAWIAIDKVSGEICILDLPKEKIDGYDVRSRISTVRQAIASEGPPERCYEDEADGRSGNRKLSIGCSYCQFKFHCWKDANEGRGLQTYYYSTGPRYLSKVIREPKVNKEETLEDSVVFPIKEKNIV